ncbi:arylsulfatase, partial [Enemella sp. A6]|uniref:arylsulfatase n=1 Tax=Enemella sp. A6 TaxID=3440152 RepID=UPI003EB7F737
MNEIDRNVIPIQPKSDAVASTTHDIRDAPPFPLPERIKPPHAAPNVLIILVDDMGFGASSAFGGPCRMPAADRLSSGGVRYTRFHTTALCSPTRAALMTGRNHHSVGMGIVPEMATSAPGYDGIRPDSMATLARVLQGNGYHTGAFGKMHQTPLWELGETGPFDRWPTNEGFDRFYGFIGGETNQFYPNLIDGLNPIEPPRTPEEGYHLSEDIVDQASGWINTVSALDPDRPWFAYVSFGACHDPLQVPESHRGRYRGEFAAGWNELRERIFDQQKKMGLVPTEAELSDFDPDVPDWATLDEDTRRMSERLMELYAEFAEHMDAQVDRLIDDVERLGQLDNTLIVYMLGDNGAAAEGGLEGSANVIAQFNGISVPPPMTEEYLAQLGGPNTYAHYPVGWALAMNTPYPRSKKYASHYGGTRNGLIMHWPNAITDTGSLRHQWHHVIDIAPTVLEAAGIPAPRIVDGVSQAPLDGVSMIYSFADPDAPSRRTRQYFEIWGSRGIYQDGWTAVTLHQPMMWSPDRDKLPSLAEDVWELYDTNADWTQARDVAAEHPELLARMQEAFMAEASRYNVLPIDDRIRERQLPATAPRPDLMGTRRSILLRPEMRGLREAAAPNVKNSSFRITADLEVPEGVADGVIIAQGGRFGGWSIYVIEGYPTYCYNRASERTYLRSDEPLTSGAHQLVLEFTYDGGGVGQGGTATMHLDGAEVGSCRLSATVPYMFSIDETMDIGCDRQTPVTDEYPDH